MNKQMRSVNLNLKKVKEILGLMLVDNGGSI